jgi:hypothetical protein
MSNLVRSKYDANTVLGFVLDEERGALITVPHENQQFSIELNHEDGDSVLSILPTIELQGNQEKPCVGIKNVVLYVVKGTAKVEVSPLSEGDLFFELSILHMNPKDICAKRIRLVVDENSEAYICGQG